jgi:hypothetical protein
VTERPPEARLPDTVTLTLVEAGQVLFALDVAIEQPDLGHASAQQVAAARKLITAKLWPELGDVLDDSSDG